MLPDVFSLLRIISAKASRIAGLLRQLKTSAFPQKAFRISITLAMVGPVLFQAGSTAAQLLYPGHDFIKGAVSSLVFGPYGWLQTLSFYVFGVSLLALGLTLFLKVRVKINAGAIFVALTGLGFILLGMHQAHVPGTPFTLSAIVHRDATIAVVAMSPLSCLFLAPSLKGTGYRGLRYYSIAVGIFAILFIAIGGQLLVQKSSLVGLFELSCSGTDSSGRKLSASSSSGVPGKGSPYPRSGAPPPYARTCSR